MPWVKFDDQYPINRKVAPLSDAAYRLHGEAIHWSSRNLTDGAIGRDDLASISKRGKPRLAGELVTRQLFHEAGYQCGSAKCPPAGADGWVIHDYWEYQPSKAEVLAERERKAAAGRLGGVRSGQTRRSKAEAEAKHGASDNGSRSEARATRLVEPPSRPDPPPSQREGGSEGAPALTRGAARPPAPPPADLLAETRAQLATASRKARTTGDRRERSALDQLRAATQEKP